MVKTIFEKSVPGRCAVLPDTLDVPPAELPEALRRNTPLALPEMSELDVIRHFTRLSQRNYGVDAQFYPLGSCTMKYNPKVAETVAALPCMRLRPWPAALRAASGSWPTSRCIPYGDACWRPTWPVRPSR